MIGVVQGSDDMKDWHDLNMCAYPVLHPPRYHRLVYRSRDVPADGARIVEGSIVKPESFGAARQRLLTQAGESQAELDRVSAHILALAEGTGDEPGG